MSTKLLEAELSYKLCGIFIEISKKYGPLYKEEFYHNICKEKLTLAEIPFKSHPRIGIYSQDSKKIMATYVPDFLIES